MIKLFVGCAPNGEDAESQAVLEYTVRKHASEDVEIIWMALSRDPRSPFYSDNGDGWQTAMWSTPFSGFRWFVPYLCHFSGKAIYSDSDVIFKGDIASLWKQNVPFGKIALAKGGGSWRYCVSLWDCEECENYFPPVEDIKRSDGHDRMSIFMRNTPQLTAPFSGNWNCLDGESYRNLNDPNIKAIHYTDMSTQPHLHIAKERLKRYGLQHWYDGKVRQHSRDDLIELFISELEGAHRAGYSVDRYLPQTNYGPIRKRSLVNYAGAGR